MNEDIYSVSPTLGFIIKTIEYEGFVQSPGWCLPSILTAARYKLNICESTFTGGWSGN